MQPDFGNALRTLALNTAKKFRDDYLLMSREAFWDGSRKNGLLHPGEFGSYREQLLATLLASHMPARLAIGSGFLGSPRRRYSTQCDIVIYDRDATPALDLAGGRVFLPTETCAAVGEVKSVLSFHKLQEALEKLSCVKEMRAADCPPGLPVAPADAVFALQQSIGDSAESGAIETTRTEIFQPATVEQQNLVTFLVCEKIEWPKGEGPETDGFWKALTALYPPKIDRYHLRHNFILSLEDGFLSYSTPFQDEHGYRSVPYPYPRHGGIDGGWRWLRADAEATHILNFAMECALAASRTWIYEFLAGAHLEDGEFPHYHYLPLS